MRWPGGGGQGGVLEGAGVGRDPLALGRRGDEFGLGQKPSLPPKLFLKARKEGSSPSFICGRSAIKILILIIVINLALWWLCLFDELRPFNRKQGGEEGGDTFANDIPRSEREAVHTFETFKRCGPQLPKSPSVHF